MFGDARWHREQVARLVIDRAGHTLRSGSAASRRQLAAARK